MIQRYARMLAPLMLLASAMPSYEQDNAPRLTFEVASIKPSKPGTKGGGIKPLPGGKEYTARNVSLKLIMGLMYKVPVWQIDGGPSWFGTDLWDIEAKADRSYSIDDLHVMFQNLLADRFGLRFHKDIREGSIYALTIDKSGVMMSVNESEPDFKIPIEIGQDWIVTGKRVPMQYFCWWLGQMLQNDQRPVIDKTGLDKNYDFTLRFAPQLPAGVPGLPTDLQDRPSIFDALRNQLGLKLESQKGPVEHYVIDHVEKPIEN